MIDLRSDTVTMPTSAMREAMFRAQIGDDVYGEDPTVNALEERMAVMFGHEAALFCASGTMANQVAIKVHTQPGDEVICDEGAHIYRYEGGGLMATSGCSVKLLHGDRGRFTAAQVEEALNDPDNPHFPRTRLVCVEDTCNRGGGAIWRGEAIAGIRELCMGHGLAMHLDGARVFNALAVTGERPEERGRLFTSISVCLSKGLGAPVGSVLVGSAAFIAQARRVRKRIGGGMRQAGFLAAAGLYALDHHVQLLGEDHRRAKELGQSLAACAWVDQILPVETNIVIFRLRPAYRAEDFLAHLKSRRILASPVGPRSVRFVTHLDIRDEDVAKVGACLQSLPG